MLLLKRLICRRLRRSMICLFLLFIFFFLLFSVTNTNTTVPCDEAKNNFVYIKMIKCASETLAAVFRRYAYDRNLSIVLPLQDKIYLGWPYRIDEFSHRPSKTGGFNVMVDHVVYNEEYMDSIMPEDSVYVTSLREPYSQFKSMFVYYNLQVNSNMSASVADPFTEYVQNMEYYESKYKSHEMRGKRYCIPDGMSMSRNLMSFNLGFPTGSLSGGVDASGDEGFINFFLTGLEAKFDLVMIVEHFDESMVLLRRLMCWSMKDILYRRRNEGKYPKISRGAAYRSERRNVAVYKQWSHVDYRLYDHFLKVFWRKVAAEGFGFYLELRYFRKMNKSVNRFCSSLETGDLSVDDVITVSSHSYGEPFTVDAKFCKELASSMNDEVRQQYDHLPNAVEPVAPKKIFC